MIKRNVTVTGLVAALAFGGVAFAAVSFSPDSGSGFVGKGDVQLAFGWNNDQLQAGAAALTFRYEDSADYDVPCKKENARQTLRNSFRRSQGVAADVTYDTRKNKQGQVTGFNLLGFDSTSVSDGQLACPGGWEADGAPVLVDATGGELSVSNGSTTAVIWTQPTAE